MFQFFENLNLKEFWAIHKKELILGLLALLLIEGAAIYYLFFYNSHYNVGLTGEQIKAFQQKEIDLIEKKYQQKIAQANRDILTQKMQCSTVKSGGITGNLETKKRQVLISVNSDKSLSPEQANKKIEEEINKLNKEADAKIAVIQEACAKEYAPKLKETLAALKKEKKAEIKAVKRSPVNNISEAENPPAFSGQPIGSGSDGSVKTEIISSNDAQKMEAVKSVSLDVGLEQMKQNAANDPNYQPADFNTMPGQSGGGIPIY